MTGEPSAYALKLLGQRSYTARDLTRKLIQKGFAAEDAESAVAKLLAERVLDDARFAFNFARSRLTTSSASPRRVAQHLIGKGVPAQVSEAAIAQVIADEGIDTTATLERVARRKFSSLSGLESDVQRRRLYGFLARRGYEMNEIRSVVQRVISAATEAAV